MKHRKLNRLENYDYSQNGMYFITICTKNREYFFGEIKNGEIILNDTGKIIKKCWLDLPNHYKNCILDEWAIMPNHFHGIIEIRHDIVETGFKPVPTELINKTHSLSEFIRGFKTFSSRRINELNGKNYFQWQRSFYDHIIRNDESLNKIREYIQINPKMWEQDRNNVENIWM